MVGYAGKFHLVAVLGAVQAVAGEVVAGEVVDQHVLQVVLLLVTAIVELVLEIVKAPLQLHLAMYQIKQEQAAHLIS